jgi:hypothetical protein
MATVDATTWVFGDPVLYGRADDLRGAWLDARDEARAAYEAWCRAASDAREWAYAVYLAAADREAAAALVSMRAGPPRTVPGPHE